MCVVIDINGEEIIAPDIVPDEVYLDSDDIRRTVKALEADGRKWASDWQRKKEERKKNNAFKKKMIKLLIGQRGLYKPLTERIRYVVLKAYEE